MDTVATDNLEQIKNILARLEECYGVAQWHPRLGPLDELIACILSQHTSDINSGRAFERLKRRYASWHDVATAPAQELIETIRCAGMAETKGPRIQNVLRLIREQQGDYTLEFLRDLSDEEARAYLTSLPGVGPKTAAIVLCFALGRPVMPVDTHVFRVSWRLGLIEKKIGEAKAHDVLQAQIPPELVYRFHVALITHGRQICRAPVPRCDACVLTDLCRHFKNA